MNNSNSRPGDDIKAKWNLLFNYVLSGGAANCQRAFDVLRAVGHAELGAVPAQEDTSAAHITPGAAAHEWVPQEESKDTGMYPELVDPMNLNKCAHCEKRGHCLDMFVCEGCENSFHPGCVSECLPRDNTDPRFSSYVCPACTSQRHLFPPYSLD